MSVWPARQASVWLPKTAHLIGSQQGTVMLPCSPYRHGLQLQAMPVGLNHTQTHSISLNKTRHTYILY